MNGCGSDAASKGGAVRLPETLCCHKYQNLIPMSYLDDLNNQKTMNPVFKVLAILLAIVLIPFGLLALFSGIGDMINVRPFIINKSFFLGLVWLLFGLGLIKRALFKNKEKEKTLIQGRSPNRYTLMLEALGYIISPVIIFLLFKYSYATSGGWTIAILMMVGLFTRYCLVTIDMLRQEGYSPYLSLTFIFPIVLMFKMAISGKHK